MEIGLASLGDLLPDPASGRCLTDVQRHRSIIEQAVLAESLGFDAVHLGEHHGSSYQLSAPAVVLAAISGRTSTLTLSTGVTLVANLDPVRVAEDYATLDCVSDGRAEIVAGRGSLFARTFEYLGQDPTQSRPLYNEHVQLLARLLTEEGVNHPGPLRAPLVNFTSRPRPVCSVPLWLGGGLNAETPTLAGRLGLPLMLPSVFAPPDGFKPHVEAYIQAWGDAGHPGQPRLGAICHCHVAANSQEARAAFRPHYSQYWNWVQDLVVAYTPRARKLPFDFETMLAGPALCGSPAEVIHRVGQWKATLPLPIERFAFMFDLGGMPEDRLRATIGRFGTDVIPHIR
jgi:alkanesulfonate monooxygenase SsuD/methylene tetrahydromethanopterin reductase-like flavin-dependent oxidoreductase (luciferase family)